jgi:hypothetical protein
MHIEKFLRIGSSKEKLLEMKKILALLQKDMVTMKKVLLKLLIPLEFK